MKWLKWTLLLCGFAVAGFLLLGFIVMHTVCKDEVTQRVLSPSQEYVAEVEESYCTVGSDWDTWVVVREQPFVLSLERLGTASDVLYVYGPASRITLHWKSGSELTVECAGCKQSEVRESHDRWKGISIHYSLTPGLPKRTVTH